MSTPQESLASSIPTVPISMLRPSTTESQTQRRKYLDKTKLAELAGSIAARGVLQPIIVRHIPSESAAGVTTPEYFEIVAGERRYLAAQKAGLEQIPANVLKLSDEDVIEIQLIENLQREDVHPMQEAEGYHELITRHRHTVEDLHTRVGKSRTYVYNRMKLVALSPKCRAAFYGDKISPSIAEKLARIPVPKTQDEALAEITANDWNYRRAAELINDHFMMKLAEAPFRTDVEFAGAGPCGLCPKRTGNQPELFADIKSADVCTDTVCFAAKVRAHSQQLVQAARDRGQTVLTGKAAEKVAPNGVHARGTYVGGGYVKLDDTEFVGNRSKKVSAIVGKDVERTLVVDDETGRSIEVVPEAAVRKALGERGERPSSPAHAAEKKTKLERKFRLALYDRIRTQLEAPLSREIAHALFDRLHHESKVLLAKVRGFEPPEKKGAYGSAHKNYDAMGDEIADMVPHEVWLFVNDCIYVEELQVHTHSTSKPQRLLDAAAMLHIDVDVIRRELAPKKTAKKAAAKTPASTKPAKPRKGK